MLLFGKHISLLKIKSAVKLTRPVNLLVIAINQFLMLYLIGLFLNPYQLPFASWPYLYFVLSLATIFLAASGYVLNDYFDTEIDEYNHPDKLIIGKILTKRQAFKIYVTLKAIGLILGIGVSLFSGIKALAIIFLIVAGMLWFYSSTYKGQAFLGNLVISALAALTLFIVVMLEIPLLIRTNATEIVKNQYYFNHIIYWVGGYSYFAFITNLIREVVKDAEDFEGDKAYGKFTVPVIYGSDFARKVIIALLFFFIASIVLFQVFLIKWRFDIYEHVSLVILLIFPALYSIFRLLKESHTEDYHLISQIFKVIMAIGSFTVFFI